MASAITITQTELLEALADCARGESSDDAKTTGEMVDESGLSPRHVLNALQTFKKQGRLRVHRVRREGLDGRRTVVSAYTIAPSPKRKK